MQLSNRIISPFAIRTGFYPAYYLLPAAGNIRALFTALNVIKFFCISIAAVLTVLYTDFFVSLLNFPYNFFLNEGYSTRISLSIISNGLTFTDTSGYPYILTIYGFLYELVCVPLFYVMEPSVNCGRIVSFISTAATVILLYHILRKKGLNIYFALILSSLFIMFKPTAEYGCFSKVDAFATLLSVIVLYSLYFHKGKKQFFFTLIFSSMALMTKQTTVFIIPVALASFFINRISLKKFLYNSAVWLGSLTAIFVILFLSIPNYFFNTVLLSLYNGMVTTSYHHLIYSQILPFIRSILFLAIFYMFAYIKYKIKIKDILSPALLYLVFYFPIFVWTSHNTGSEPVYYTFIFAGFSILLGELIVKLKLQNSLIINTFVLAQFIIFLVYPSSIYFMKIDHYKPTQQMISEANEINAIIKSKGIENSYATFSYSAYGLSKESANNFFDFTYDGLLAQNLLDINPLIKDLNEKKFSVIIGRLNYPQTQEVFERNYKLYKMVDQKAIFVPIK